MEIENKLVVDGTYIFHFEGEEEHNHVLHLRENDTFSQRIYQNDKKTVYNFMRSGKYKKQGNTIELHVEHHHKLNPDDKSENSKDKKYIVKVDQKTGDLENVPVLSKNDLKSFLKIITFKEPEKKYNFQTLLDYFVDEMNYSEPVIFNKSTTEILYAPLKLKLIKKKKCFNNLDTPIYQLFEPNSYTGVVSLSVMESAATIKSRRNFNIILTSFEKKQENMEMPSNHDDLIKKGGKCPVIHGEDEDEDEEESSDTMTDCPFDHTQCKQQ